MLIAASGPWNAELAYDGNPTGDWITYFTDVIDLLDGAFDGYSLHAYTHGYDVALVTSTARMDAPFQNRYYNFLTYRDYCNAVPADYKHLPAYITEANGNGPWQAVGLMPAMLGEIDWWNSTHNEPSIQCVTFYRYPRYDDFYIEGRADVIAEYNQAVARGYMAPLAGSPITSPIPEPPPDPGPPNPTPPTPAPPPDGGSANPDGAGQAPQRTIDPALVARGVKFEFVSPAAGTGYWRITKAEWLDEAEADAVGPDHHILGVVSEEMSMLADVPLKVTWPSGSTTFRSKAPQSNVSYNYDYPMSSSLNEFSIWVDDGNPTDKVSGIGMGANGNPSLHTSTWIDWEWVIAETPIPPIPPVSPHTQYVIALAGANLRAEPVTGAVMVAIPYAEAVTVDESQMGSDGYQWRHAIYEWYKGWIRSDLLSAHKPEPPTPTPEPPIPPIAGDLVHPLPGATITQNFYQNPADYAAFSMPGHDGTDFGGKPAGTPIRCMAAGVVMRAEFDAGGYGNFVEVAHDAKGATTVYAHASKLTVKVGDVVTAGQTIALLGSTGNSTGVHLHLSVRLINRDGSYKAGTPMAKGRVDPRTWAILYGLTL